MTKGFVQKNLLKDGLKKYYGKFRGLVTDNKDPKNKGRLKIKVPKVLGHHSTTWALPSLGSGIFVIPKINTGVWVEFEQGNPNKPVWTGIWLADDEVLEDVVEQGFMYDIDQNSLEIFGSSEINIRLDENSIKLDNSGNLTINGGNVIIEGGEVKLGGNNANEGVPLGDALKQYLDSHNHDYSWTDSGGSGTTSTPNQNCPEPSDSVVVK